jgi:DNA-binding XRE family transcriptional regulator
MASLAKQSPIRAARLKRQMTQAEVGAHVGATKATVSGWENGRYQPEPQKAISLAALLGIRLEQVYAQQGRA